MHKVASPTAATLDGILPGGEYFEVPTHHHQAVNRLGDGLTAVGWADDGIIEAIEGTSEQDFLVGVQWHPEQGQDPRLFSALVAAAENSRRTVASLRSMPTLLADA